MPYRYYCPSCQQVLEAHDHTVGQTVQCPYCKQVFPQPPNPQMAAAPNPGYGQQPGMQQQMPAGYGQPMPGQQPAGYPGAGYPGGAQPGYPGAAPGGYPGAPDPYGQQQAAAGGYGQQQPAEEGGFSISKGPETSNEIIHIPCPNRQCPYHAQPLEVHSSMVGQDVMCPLCQTTYTLHYDDSIEYRSRQEEAIRRKEEKFARSALNWAIAAVIIVVFGMVVMMVMLSGKGPGK